MKIDLKIALKIRWVASLVTVFSYLAYYDQARLNCISHSGSLILPVFSLIGCNLWIVSSYFREEVDWQTIACCALGLVMTALAIVTLIQPAVVCSYLPIK